MNNGDKNQTKQRGGRRPGAGRKVKRIKSLVRRCDKATAAMILAVVDEQSKWLEFIDSNDERIALDAMKFLTQMRDGRPRQQVDLKEDRGISKEELASMTDEQLIDALREQVAAFDAEQKLKQASNSSVEGRIQIAANSRVDT